MIPDHVPSPIWLAERVKARRLHQQAVAEDWTISQLVSESLRLGLVPTMTFGDRPGEPFAELRKEIQTDYWKDFEHDND